MYEIKAFECTIKNILNTIESNYSTLGEALKLEIHNRMGIKTKNNLQFSPAEINM